MRELGDVKGEALTLTLASPNPLSHAWERGS